MRRLVRHLAGPVANFPTIMKCSARHGDVRRALRLVAAASRRKPTTGRPRSVKEARRG
jgi:hypothetical protein